MDRINFTVNDVQYSVESEVSSTTTLLEYLRNYLELRGTKYMCKEAGCGACIVSAAKCPGEVPQAVNACMVPITSCKDWKIETIENIGNRKDGYHVIQKTLAEHNGTQCGYCSPGWVMSLYSLLQKRRPTMLEIEKSFGSNVCRCTGYRPILEAFKRFAKNSPNPIRDIEDLSICNKNGGLCKKNCVEDEWCLVSDQDFPGEPIYIKLKDNKNWFRPVSLDGVIDILIQNGSKSYMLVAGNTGKGVFPIDEYPNILIDVSALPELKNYYFDQNLVIGAGTTLSELEEIFEKVTNTEYFEYLSVFNDHLHLVAHIAVKNEANEEVAHGGYWIINYHCFTLLYLTALQDVLPSGTIAGNLMLKHQHPKFPSDIFVLLETVGAQITIVNSLRLRKTISMQEFLRENMNGKVILNVMLPPLNSSCKVITFKIMPRSQNAHAIVNCGFLYKFDHWNKVTYCRMVYGDLSKSFSRAINTENYLIGKEIFTNRTLQAALHVLNSELIVEPDLPNPSVEYRRHLALALFYKGLLSIFPTKGTMSSRYVSGSEKIHETRPVSEGRQIFDTNPSLWPLNKPIPRIDGLIQCAGEATYTEDISSLPREVFAAFVLTTVPLGTIVKIDPDKAMKYPGVIAFYSAKDIPGPNSFTPAGRTFNLTNEELLCDGEVKYYNQPLGIIVGESEAIAERAAKLVSVTYKNVKKPVIDVKVAKMDPSKVTLFIANDATKTGDDVRTIIKGENTIYGQYAFCMETLVCVSHPIEEGIKAYVATQWTDVVQQMISRVLQIQQNRIDVYVRRLGGAYGFKLSRPTQIGVACSLVTYKLNRPCRFIQSLRNNMRAIGKRLPCSTTFEVAVNDKGVIQYMNYNLYSDNGYIVNEPFLQLASDNYNNCYDKSPWTFKAYTVITDTASNTWCRSPGTLETIAMIEWIMERISYEIYMDPVEVRLRNLDNAHSNDMRELVDTLKINSDYAKRRLEVDKFNSNNRWKKRGLRFTFLRWTPNGGPYMDMNMSVYHDDGTVAIAHGGIEMGQGINTKAIQICAYLLNIPVEKVQIKPNDTIISPNNFASGGSLTSQNVCIGVRRCCEELLRRLEPIRTQLNNPTWEELIKKAHEMDIDLQTHGFINGNDMQNYHIYGVTLAEVEIDVLTGEWEIKRVDLLEDVGRSVNPDIDIGQVEGAYIMGVGYATCENLVYRPETGELLTDRTWEYWVPQARDIPQDFRIYFRKRSFSTDVIFGSKGTGEPATCMGVGVAFALREAIVAARAESGLPRTQWFDIDGPYTVEKNCLNCATNIEDFKFY